ncbi:hypothetical protein NDU88_005753 [Pleurodeles waltl]|uniref:Uncharacterized protein n=1 Tax=Pleurodeles waltl TaxID=8319 RepID=A0AAV7QGW5_PLEWA|nr:hypothetical protein NDU88_005753 [Pleurodeles waltl]
MSKDRANKGTQQTQMDQYTALNSGESLQKDPPGPLKKGAEPTGVQILGAIESSSRATQTQIASLSVDVNLLRTDLWVVAERLVATEQRVTCMQSDMDTLKASDWLERNYGTGMPERCMGRVAGDPEGQQKYILQHAEVSDAIVPAVEAE